ncbi:MAG: hypothetical protein GTO40_21440 [Deltaproteobacteria bacterium]|nr:hypothetical protein [Deltaproteobacteria bacterium]
MADLKLDLVLGPHAGRFKPLMDGKVRPEGIELNAAIMAYDELFWRIPNDDNFDVAELSLTGYLWGIQHGKRWIAIPVFPGWVFSCHTETLCNVEAGIQRPEDLKGKRVGVPEYAVTAIAWIRYAFETQHGVRPQDIHWFEERTAEFSHYRPLGYAPPADVRVEIIPKEKRLCDMVIAGELDAVTRYFGKPENATATHQGDRSHLGLLDLGDHTRMKWLYPDRKAAGIAYHKEIGFLQPIHCVILKQEIADAHPWVPKSLCNAFAEAARLSTDTPPVSPPSYRLSREEQLKTIGADFSTVGLGTNHAAVSCALKLFNQQGYVDRGRPFTVEEFFHVSTLDI